MFPLLAVLGQVIPKGTESPFLAVRLRRCWAWNPITGAAMPALWHQTLPMQNTTAGVYHQLTPQPSCCRGIHWRVTWLTRGGRDDTSNADVGQNERHWMWCRGRRARGRLQMISFEHLEGKSPAGQGRRYHGGSMTKSSTLTINGTYPNNIVIIFL